MLSSAATMKGCRCEWIFLLLLWGSCASTEASGVKMGSSFNLGTFGPECISREELRKRQASTPPDTDVLRLAAFNIRIFGTTKFSKPEVVEVLSRIVRRYDITLIQEIRDRSETVILDFLERVNMDAAADGVTFDLIVSERLGRTVSKEQYAYLYRVGSVELSRPYQFNDSADDVFEREPYAVMVQSLLIDLPPFFLLGLHSAPDHVMPELNGLDDVFDLCTDFYRTLSGIILGDLNADCSFLSQTRYNQLDLVLDERFTWLIGNDADTTTTSTDCAYDRFIVAGAIGTQVVADSADVFRYDTEYQLDQELTEDVSDHYPIECLIEGSLLTQSPTTSSEGQGSTNSGTGPLHSTPSVIVFIILLICRPYVTIS